MRRKSIPILLLKLIKIVLIDLESAFQPCLSVITWSSLKISQVCADIKKAIHDMQIFVKEMRDIKEAQVDEVLECIAETTMLQLDKYPKNPEQFLADNLAFRDKIAIDLEIKSAAAERAVIMIINNFMHHVTDPTVQDVKYNWMDIEKVHKQVGSETRLIDESFEPGISHVS